MAHPRPTRRAAPVALRAALRLTLLLITVITAPAACGYTSGGGLRDRGFRTVAVDVVGNETFRQGLEREISAEVYRNLVLTDLRLTQRDRADLLLRSALVDDQGRVLVAGGGLPLLEGALELGIRVTLVDNRTGQILRQGLIGDAVEFRLPVGESLDAVSIELNRDIGRKIVLFLESSF